MHVPVALFEVKLVMLLYGITTLCVLDRSHCTLLRQLLSVATLYLDAYMISIKGTFPPTVKEFEF